MMNPRSKLFPTELVHNFSYPQRAGVSVPRLSLMMPLATTNETVDHLLLWKNDKTELEQALMSRRIRILVSAELVLAQLS
jgi:hypothetical protein